jgi:hypothetical protein
MSFFLDFLEKFTGSMLEKPGGPAPRGMGRIQTQAGVRYPERFLSGRLCLTRGICPQRVLFQILSTNEQRLGRRTNR